MSRLTELVLAVVSGLVLLWVCLVAFFWWARPSGQGLMEAVRLGPDVIRLTRRLAADRTLSCSLRVRLWLLLAYLLSPIDLIPDFIPGVGYADDAIIVVLVIRSVLRAAGTQAIERHWPGSPEGLQAVLRFGGAHSKA